jgi:hypothetical protein
VSIGTDFSVVPDPSGAVSDHLHCANERIDMARLELFTAVKIQIAVFRFVILCSVVVGYQRFGGPCCLLLQGEDPGVKGADILIIPSDFLSVHLQNLGLPLPRFVFIR